MGTSVANTGPTLIRGTGVVKVAQHRSVHSQVSKPFGTLGALAIAVGVGVLGAYMLDLHGHACERCGRRWRHFGAFNFGDEQSHTCTCGQVQWWKCGMPHVLRGSQFVGPSPALPAAPLPATTPVHAWDEGPVHVLSPLAKGHSLSSAANVAALERRPFEDRPSSIAGFSVPTVGRGVSVESRGVPAGPRRIPGVPAGPRDRSAAPLLAIQPRRLSR
jgi:hypothetical protein